MAQAAMEVGAFHAVELELPRPGGERLWAPSCRAFAWMKLFVSTILATAREASSRERACALAAFRAPHPSLGVALVAPLRDSARFRARGPTLRARRRGGALAQAWGRPLADRRASRRKVGLGFLAHMRGRAHPRALQSAKSGAAQRAAGWRRGGVCARCTRHSVSAYLRAGTVGVATKMAGADG